jgi:subtilisin family serine protease
MITKFLPELFIFGFLGILMPLQSTVAESNTLISERAILSYRSKFIGQSALDKAYAKIGPSNMRAEKVGNQIFVLNTRRNGIVRKATKSDTHNEFSVHPLSRKTNPCKRARVRRLLKNMRRAGRRVRCEPDFIAYASKTPNDPLYQYQYAVSNMALESAWELTTGDTDILTLVLDTGIQYDHPDLADNVWVNPGEIPNNGIDDDGNGYRDDVHGFNAIYNTGDPYDDNGHGTHCAGILGASGDNGEGITGAAWRTKIVSAKFLAQNGGGRISDALKGIYYGIALKQAGHNIVVSNNSWGMNSYSAALYTAIQASEEVGIAFVAAAGNNRQHTDENPHYPSSFNLDGIIAVASTDSEDRLSTFSNFGPRSVDIAAPGTSILSSYISSIYERLSGTSMATPQITGVVILMQAACRGTLTTAEVKEILLTTGTYSGALNGVILSNSVVNAYQAVRASIELCDARQPEPTPTPSATPTATQTPVNTPTSTPSPTLTATPSPTLTSTPPPLLTDTPTGTPTPSPRAPRLRVLRRNNRSNAHETRISVRRALSPFTVTLSANSSSGQALCSASRVFNTTRTRAPVLVFPTGALPMRNRYVLKAAFPSVTLASLLRGSDPRPRSERRFKRRCKAILNRLLRKALR